MELHSRMLQAAMHHPIRALPVRYAMEQMVMEIRATARATEPPMAMQMSLSSSRVTQPA
ncbi:MAG TPA: hypothetical protein VLG46_11940 [Anaerolineae bacterium]|nr:hypothetical protein [Anaerolineae bacterium]